MSESAHVESFRTEYRRYRRLAEAALDRVPDDALHRPLDPEGNSVAVLIQHLTGNLRSRFTDFLTSDGEKPWRERDRELEDQWLERSELEAAWRETWELMERELGALHDSDLGREVAIRGRALTVHAALARSAAHLAYHVGQIVLLAQVHSPEEWESLSIPRGGSEEYNRAPDREEGPRQGG